MMRSFTSIALLLSLVPGSLGKLAALSNPNLPYPFAPPSDDFCKSNTLGDDTYLSFFKPCEFAFFTASSKPDHFSCDSFDESMAIKIESRKVLFWPESCIAAGPRCYDLKDYPDLSNFTIYDDVDNFSMRFPPEATVVSVDCTADYTQAQVFLDNLPEELEDVAQSIAFVGIVLFVAVLAGIVACICCICFCCFGARKKRRDDYTPIHVQHGILLTPEATTYHEIHQDKPDFPPTKVLV
jgi:hypothetical protein